MPYVKVGQAFQPDARKIRLESLAPPCQPGKADLRGPGRSVAPKPRPTRLGDCPNFGSPVKAEFRVPRSGLDKGRPRDEHKEVSGADVAL